MSYEFTLNQGDLQTAINYTRLGLICNYHYERFSAYSRRRCNLLENKKIASQKNAAQRNCLHLAA